MIVNWKQERILVIPVPTKTLSAVESISGGNNIRFLPGYNQVDDIIWEGVKPSLVHHLKVKNLEEIVEEATEEITETNNEGKKEKKKVKRKKSVSIENLSPEELENVLAQTNDLDTLKGWKNKLVKDESRAMLKDRIDEIEHYIKTGKKKIGD